MKVLSTTYHTLFIVFFTLIINALSAQQKTEIYMERADLLEIDNAIADGAQRLIGNVIIHHKDVIIYCDSAYMYSQTNSADAFGNVHVNKNDTLNLFANEINYDGNNNYAIAKGDVQLKKRETTLYSDRVNFDLNTNIGYYTDYGKIIDSTNILESTIGEYHVNADLAYFFQNVVAYNDNYRLEGDTLIYNTQSTLATIQGPTNIKDSTNTLYSEKGWYNTTTGDSELTKNPFVFNERYSLKAEYLKYEKAADKGKAKKQVEIYDKENNTEVLGNYALYSESLEVALMTDSAQFIAYSEADTLYLHADTLKVIPDTIDEKKIIKAYFGVRFYRTDMQGVCDSMLYYTNDSTIHLYRKPIIWSENNQMTADYMFVRMHENQDSEALLKSNSFIISELDSGRFDQIKGKKMLGYFDRKNLKRIKVNGNGQSLYYAQDNGEIIGLNKTVSSNLTIYFAEGKVDKITFLKKPDAILKPLHQLTEEDKKLAGFKWYDAIRPKDRYDIFREEEEVTDESRVLKEKNTIKARTIEN